jgi:maltose O-acetyltransferase
MRTLPKNGRSLANTPDQVVYKINELERPNNDFITRILLALNRIPVFRNISLIKWGIRKKFNFPASVEFNKGFYSSSRNLIVGENVSLSDVFILAYAPIIIGENSGFSFKNTLITSTHDVNNFSTIIAKPIKIGKNCWITTNVTILPGVTIGDGTIIGAGSVVTRDIPSGVFAAGNPCKVIKKIHFKKN